MIQSSLKQEELLQCFDERRRPTEGRPVSEVKAVPYRWWCGVSNIWVVNRRGNILCSKRAHTLSRNPGKWQSYFGGHVSFGLSFEETAIKELEEEAGLHAFPEDLFFVEEGMYEENKQFYKSFVTIFEGDKSDIAFTDGEIIDAKWMSMDEYWNEKERRPGDWCHRCLPHHQRIILDWLALQNRLRA